MSSTERGWLQVKLEGIDLKYLQGWMLFEATPELIYQDEKLTDELKLETIPHLNEIVPETIEAKIEEEYEKIIILKDEKGNRYRFEKLPR